MQYLKNSATLKLDSELCTGCGMCTVVCPHAVFEINNKKALILELDNCMECGACALNCKTKALTVKKGVGCAAAVIYGLLNGTEPSCDCTTTSKQSCC